MFKSSRQQSVGGFWLNILLYGEGYPLGTRLLPPILEAEFCKLEEKRLSRVFFRACLVALSAWFVAWIGEASPISIIIRVVVAAVLVIVILMTVNGGAPFGLSLSSQVLLHSTMGVLFAASVALEGLAVVPSTTSLSVLMYGVHLFELAPPSVLGGWSVVATAGFLLVQALSEARPSAAVLALYAQALIGSGLAGQLWARWSLAARRGAFVMRSHKALLHRLSREPDLQGQGEQQGEGSELAALNNGGGDGAHDGGGEVAAETEAGEGVGGGDGKGSGNHSLRSRHEVAATHAGRQDEVPLETFRSSTPSHRAVKGTRGEGGRRLSSRPPRRSSASPDSNSSFASEGEHTHQHYQQQRQHHHQHQHQHEEQDQQRQEQRGNVVAMLAALPLSSGSDSSSASVPRENQGGRRRKRTRGEGRSGRSDDERANNEEEAAETLLSSLGQGAGSGDDGEGSHGSEEQASGRNADPTTTAGESHPHYILAGPPRGRGGGGVWSDEGASDGDPSQQAPSACAHISLEFADGHLEDRYEAFLNRHSLRRTQLLLALFLLSQLSLGILEDSLLEHNYVITFLVVRYGVLVPLLASCLLLSSLPFFSKRIQGFTVVPVVLVGLCILFLNHATPSTVAYQHVRAMYFASWLHFIMHMSTTLRLRLLFSIFTTVILSCAYGGYMIGFWDSGGGGGKSDSGSVEVWEVLASSFVVIGGVIFLRSAELLSRETYYLSRTLPRLKKRTGAPLPSPPPPPPPPPSQA